MSLTQKAKRHLRFFGGFGIGIAVNFGLMLWKDLVPGIHPLDWWHNFRVFAFLGCLFGLFFGWLWAWACDKPRHFKLFEPTRWGRLHFVIGLTFFGAVFASLLLRLFVHIDQVRSSYIESYHETLLSSGAIMGGALIGAVVAHFVLKSHDQRHNE